MSHLILLPSVHQPTTDLCLATLSPYVRDTVEVVDNTETNRGVAASWNIGVDLVHAREVDWLVILSAGVRFGPLGGEDFAQVLEDQRAAGAGVAGRMAHVIEAADGLGWHLIAFHRETLALVGPFDEGWFAYYEDNDWSYRYQLAHSVDSRAPGWVGPLWPKVKVDAKLADTAHGIRFGGVTVNFVEGEARFVRKWGGPSSAETYRHPWGDPSLDWTYVGPEPEPVA